MLFAYLLRERISVVTVIESTFEQEIDTAHNHYHANVIREILNMLNWNVILILRVINFFELVVNIRDWADHEHEHLHYELD